MVYEGLLSTAVAFAAALVFGLLTQTRNAMDNRLGLQIFVFAVLGLYFAWFWSKGQTLAMKTWHIHLQSRDGQKVPFKVALLRYGIAWLGILPPIVLAWSLGWPAKVNIGVTIVWFIAWNCLCLTRKDRQFLHDAWAGTHLVHLPPAPRIPSSSLPIATQDSTCEKK